MNGNAELLNLIYQNSQMGVDTIKKLKDIVKDKEFKKHLKAQYKGYKEIHASAREKLKQNGFSEKGLSAFDKMKTRLMINIQTMTDKSVSHISEMLIIGSNMGVINAVKNLKKYNDAEEEVKGLMEKLLGFEEYNIQQLKAFL